MVSRFDGYSRDNIDQVWELWSTGEWSKSQIAQYTDLYESVIRTIIKNGPDHIPEIPPKYLSKREFTNLMKGWRCTIQS